MGGNETIASRCAERIVRETLVTLLDLAAAGRPIRTLRSRGDGCVNVLLFTMFAAWISIRDNRAADLDDALVENVAQELFDVGLGPAPRAEIIAELSHSFGLMRGVYTEVLTVFSGEPVANLATLAATYVLDEVDAAPELVDSFERVFCHIYDYASH